MKKTSLFEFKKHSDHLINGFQVFLYQSFNYQFRLNENSF